MTPALPATAALLGCEPRALAAVVAVESSGSGFDPTGRPVIRVEAHLVWRLCGPEKRAAVDEHFHVAGPEIWEGHTFRLAATDPWAPYHGDPDREWLAYATAYSIDDQAACRATSWGMGQVLGEWATLGFDSAPEFIAHQGTAEGQLDTMARYILRAGLKDALARKDWEAFARGYNGNGQVEVYAHRLADAYGRAVA